MTRKLTLRACPTCDIQHQGTEDQCADCLREAAGIKVPWAGPLESRQALVDGTVAGAQPHLAHRFRRGEPASSVSIITSRGLTPPLPARVRHVRHRQVDVR